MPFLSQLFTCNNNIQNEEISNLKVRVNNLELKCDTITQVLQEIRTSIEMIRMRLELMNQPRQPQ